MTEAEEEATLAANTDGGEPANTIHADLGDEPWFGGVWIDNANRRVVVATTRDVAELQSDLDGRFGPAAVRAVGVERSETDLQQVHDAVARWYATQHVRSGGYGTFILKNVVNVGLEVLDPEVVADLSN